MCCTAFPKLAHALAHAMAGKRNSRGVAEEAAAVADPAETLPQDSKSARLVEPEETCVARWNQLDDDALQAEVGQYR